jgi:uncharacterized Tic20 family protein
MNENENQVPPAAAPPPDSGAATAPVAGSNDERMWAMFTHLSALIGLCFPFGWLIGPLVVWLIKKNEMPLVDDQGKEALNFQLTMTIAFLVCCLLMLVLIGFLLVFVVGVFDLIMIIVAAVQANNGVRYRYPLTIRFIR